ncbi:MAG: 3-dehydroquinate synthase [Candidatus Omnitrophica bacterium]|nr:3-dehydroquinate synthase [Candidatus Omnitrophota bacterium]
MRIIKVRLKEYPYDIVVGRGIIKSLGKFIRKLNLGKDAYIITNATIKNKYGKILERSLKKYNLNIRFRLIPDSEKSKSLLIALRLINDLARYDYKTKRVFIIAFGGGVVGDLSGFIASIYKRGIPYLQVPTTLLAQVDSSIGGKTALDLVEGKNLVGTFYQPRIVVSDTSLLKTLKSRQIKSAMAEIIKTAAIKDKKLFNYLEKNYRNILNLRDDTLRFVIERCSRIKAKIVQQDERENKGIRTILNFGHTIGHALEAAAGYRHYNHGEAVALGMLVASDLSKALGLIDEKTQKRLENLIKAVGLPIRINRVPITAIIKAYYYDKKFITKKNRFVLLKEIGKTKIVENISLKLIKRVLAKRITNQF